jgi:hypothetical protein
MQPLTLKRPTLRTLLTSESLASGITYATRVAKSTWCLFLLKMARLWGILLSLILQVFLVTIGFLTTLPLIERFTSDYKS